MKNVKRKTIKTKIIQGEKHDFPKEPIVEETIEDKRQKYLNEKLIETANREMNLGEIMNLLNQGADVNARNDEGETILMTAAFWENTHVCGVLIDNGADIDAKDKDGWTALMFAVLGRHIECVEYLLSRGANPLFRESDNRFARQITVGKFSVSTQQRLGKLIKAREKLWGILGRTANSIIMHVKNCSPENVKDIFVNL